MFGRIVSILLVVFAVLTALGILIPFVVKSRATTDRMRCLEHLRAIGGFGILHTAKPGVTLPEKRDVFPSGTVFNAKLPPEQRLSFYAAMLQALPLAEAEARQSKYQSLVEEIKKLDPELAWDADPHRNLSRTRLSVLICPANVPLQKFGEPAPTLYIGSAGLGENTAALTPEMAGKNAGIFRYDTPTPREAVTDGISHTIQIAEIALQPGPWMQGGPSTVRSLPDSASPLAGPERMFGGNHRGGANFSFADGSARFISENVQPAVLRASLTIAGNESETFE